MNQPHEPAGSEPRENVQKNIKEDEEYVNNMRGWLMTVATLFVGMAFQAAIELPAWFPDDWPQAFSSYNMKHSDPSPATTLTKGQMRGIQLYITSNAITFTIALAFLITLLEVGRSSARLSISLMNSILSTMLIISTSITFVLGISSDWTVVRRMLIVLSLLGPYTLFICLAWPMIMKHCIDKKSRREAQGKTASPP